MPVQAQVHAPSPTRPHRPARTPRKWSVELAPDDSVLFAKGLETQGAEQVELDLDLDESVEPPWAAESSDGGERSDSDQDQIGDEAGQEKTARRTEADVTLPNLPDLDGLSDDSWAGEGSIKIPPAPPPPAHRPPSRARSRFSASPSVRRSQSPPSFTTARSNDRSASFSRRAVPPVEPVLTPEPVRVKPVTPPKAVESDMSTRHSSGHGLTPRPPGAWFSASKPRHSHVQFSPLRQVHTPDTSDETSISMHKLKLSPRRAKVEDHTSAGDTSFTRRLLNLSKTMTGAGRNVPAPSTTLAEAQAALDRAARASALARRKVEHSQKQWIEALSMTSRTKAAAVEVLRRSWTWGTWAWWISLELLLLWGVFR